MARLFSFAWIELNQFGSWLRVLGRNWLRLYNAALFSDPRCVCYRLRHNTAISRCWLFTRRKRSYCNCLSRRCWMICWPSFLHLQRFGQACNAYYILSTTLHSIPFHCFLLPFHSVPFHLSFFSSSPFVCPLSGSFILGATSLAPAHAGCALRRRLLICGFILSQHVNLIPWRVKRRTPAAVTRGGWISLRIAVDWCHIRRPTLFYVSAPCSKTTTKREREKQVGIKDYIIFRIRPRFAASRTWKRRAPQYVGLWGWSAYSQYLNRFRKWILNAWRIWIAPVVKDTLRRHQSPRLKFARYSGLLACCTEGVSSVSCWLNRGRFFGTERWYNNLFASVSCCNAQKCIWGLSAFISHPPSWVVTHSSATTHLLYGPNAHHIESRTRP